MLGAARAYSFLIWSAFCAASDLHTAVRAGDFDTTKALLLAGASATERDSLGGTALHDASWRGDTRLIELLLDNHANVNAEHEETGSTPLHYAVITNRPEAVSLLLKSGANIASKSLSGTTALHLAANRGYTRMVELLLNNGAVPDVADQSGSTPLFEAAWKGHGDVAQALLAAGASPNARNATTGATPLHEAAAKGQPTLVELLLARGADAKIKNKAGETALDQADRFRQLEVVAVFVDRKVEGSTPAAYRQLKEAVLRGELESVRLFLQRGIDPNQDFLLHDAALKGHIDVVRLLLRHGANVNAANASGATALHDAALAGNAAVAEALAGAGASLNARDTETGATPLHYSASWGRLEAVATLLRFGADSSIPNRAGLTPISAAIANGHSAVVVLLRENRSR